MEIANGFWIEKRGGNGDQIVAADDARIGKAQRGSDFNL